MKVLVVGAAGKTGRAVVERAVQEGHEVTAFVHSAGDFGIPEYLHPQLPAERP